MSFASDTKNAICKTTEPMWCCRRSELCALVCFAGDLCADHALKIRLENAGVVARIEQLLKEILGISQLTHLRRSEPGGWHTLLIRRRDVIENLADGLGLFHDGEIALFPEEQVTDFDCCKLGFIRGAFLGGGCITSPEKNYHMEFVTKTAPLADRLLSLLEFYSVSAKLTVRKNNFVVYIKESEAIAELLGSMGAGGAMMALYNVKIERELRNAVNRQVNCDSANLVKIASAASRHIKAITQIAQTGGLDALPEALREVARLRLENPELTLGELGALANPPLGKSGVNHRLKKLMEIAGGPQ